MSGAYDDGYDLHMQSAASDPSTDTADSDLSTAVDDVVVDDVVTLDLAAIEADLADVEVALARLDAGTYWTCEVTGQPLSEELMAAEPTRRRAPSV
jgi:RNA polymerase-binding transcription factor DksA